MTLRDRFTWQRKSRSPSSYTTTSNRSKASDKENLNVYKSFRIEASLEYYPTSRGRNLFVVIKLETIPETTILEIAQSSKLRSIKPANNAAEDMNYPIEPSDASRAESKNERAKGSADHSFQPPGISSIKSENMDKLEKSDDSFQDLSWILLLPGLFPLDNEETENSSPLLLDVPTSTTSHTSAEQSSTNPPVSRGLSFREKPPTPALPFPFNNYDLKATSYPTVSKSGSLRKSTVHLPQEDSIQPGPSIRPQAFLPKDIGRPKPELHQQQQLAVASEQNTDECSSRPPMPSRTPPIPPKSPPIPPKSEKRQPIPTVIPPPRPPSFLWKPLDPGRTQPVPVVSPPPRHPPPPWKSLDTDKRPSIQIETPLPRPTRHPEISPEPEQQQFGRRGSKRPITQRVFRGCRNFIDDALRLPRSSLRKDSAYSFTPSQIDVDHTQAGPESIKTATRAPPLSPPHSNLFSPSSYEKSREKGDISTSSSRNSETDTNSTAPSIATKAGSFLSKATSFKVKTNLSRILSRKENVRGDINDSGVYPDFPAIKEKHQLPELDFRSRTLLPYQCTMCFMQLNNRAEWIQHEQDHNDDDDDEEISGWYWRCGICDNILHSWDDRQNHIADEHFEIGQTLSSWNSSTSPYPWHKLSSTPISGFPYWDMSIIRSMQPTILDDIYRKAEPRNACDVCDLAFPASSELDQHMRQNHVSWSCPTTTKKWKAPFFFEMCRDGCENQFHSCRCCYRSFCNDSADWKQRKQHFEKKHHFLNCDHDQFFEHAQFCHHLANCHGVEIDFLSMTDLCREKEYASYEE